jgi:hypothetical protein
MICTDEYEPVCGCDGVTYANSCYAEKVSLASWSDGPCDGEFSCGAADGTIAATQPPAASLCVAGSYTWIDNVPVGGTWDWECFDGTTTLSCSASTGNGAPSSSCGTANGGTYASGGAVNASDLCGNGSVASVV